MPKPTNNEPKQDFLKRCTNELIETENLSADSAFKQCNLTWDNSNNQRSVLSLHLPIEFKKSDKLKKQADKFLITAYTGKPIDTWFGSVIFDLAGMQSKEKIPVLREHKRDRVVGFGNTFADEKNYYVSGDFSKSTPDSKEVRELADEGYPWQASVAIWPKVVEILENAKSTKTVNGQEISGPAEIWKESEVGEVSFVSLGRDDDTAAISLTESASKVAVEIYSDSGTGESVHYYQVEDSTMEFSIEILKEQAPELLAEIEDAAFAEGREEGIDCERERVCELLNADADPVETRKMIDDGVEASDAYKHFYEAEKTKRADGLKQMQAEATEAQKTDEPEVKTESDDAPVDEKLAKMAQKLAAKEGIDLYEAQKRINAENPELTGSWQPVGM